MGYVLRKHKELLKTKLVINSTKWNLINGVITLVRGVMVNILLARYLGVSGYGEYSFLVSLVTILVSNSHLGIDNIAIKDLACVEDKDRATYISTSKFVVVLGTCFSILILFLFKVLIGGIKHLYVVLMCCLLIVQYMDIYRWNLIASYKTNMMTIFKSIINVVSVLILVIGITAKLKFSFFFLLYIITEQLLLLSPRLITAHSLEDGKAITNVDYKLAKRLFRVSLPLWIGAISVSVYLRIDQVMISEILTNRDLGIYAVAVRISEMWFFVPTILCTSFLPYFSEKYNEDEDAFWSKYETFVYILISMAYLFAIAISLFGGVIIKILYGYEYIEALGIIRIYSWGGIFVCMGVARSIYLTVKEYTVYACAFSVVAACTNCIMNYLLIPKMGILGATIATLVAYAIQAYAMNFFSKKLSKIQILSTKGIMAPVFLVKQLWRK